MQRNYKYKLFLLFLVFPIALFSQNCSKKKLATKEMLGEFDYRGQSIFLELVNGQTSTLKVVLYSKQNYKIFVANEQKLGKVNYKIYVPRKKFNRVVKDVKPKEVNVYKKDPEGFYLTDYRGDRIPIGKETIQDTIWTRETVDMEELVFDSRFSEQNYWLATPNKTQQVTIIVDVETATKPIKGCVGLYVGREYSNIYQFRR